MKNLFRSVFSGKPEPARPKYLTNGAEIKDFILKELAAARSTVDVAVAWFTDQDLLDALVNCAKRGVRVRLVIAENAENERLDFESAASHFDRFLVLKGQGFGTMHRKSCIVDSSVVFLGSYNWTNNAFKNNAEELIVNEETETIRKVEEAFQELLDGKVDGNHEVGESSSTKKDQDRDSSFFDALESVLADWAVFEDSTLEAAGRVKASESNGSSSGLKAEFNILRSDLKRQMAMQPLQKADLKLRINALHEEEKLLLQDEQLKNEALLRAESTQVKQLIQAKRNPIETHLKGIKSKIEENRAARSEKKGVMDRLNSEIDQLKQSQNENRLVWFRWVPLAVFAAVLLIYLVMFYSSAFYILLYGVAEAKAVVMSGGALELSLFEFTALPKLYNFGWSALIFGVLVAFVPIALSLLSLFWNNKWGAELVTIFVAILGVDLLLAFQLIDTLHYIKSLEISGGGSAVVTEAAFFTNPDFWLAFVLGALPLFLFKLMVQNLARQLNSTEDGYWSNTIRAGIKKLESKIHEAEQEVSLLDGRAEELETEFKSTESELNRLDDEVAIVESSLERDLSLAESRYSAKFAEYQRVVEIFHSRIESSLMPLTKDMILGRVDRFLSGWRAYLFEKFASAVAEEFWTDALTQRDLWFDEHFKGDE